uniref:Methyltransferase type 11 domain-containing protein n=1 Tax=Knipowitschia caucasica TaxID=637954 RepID=A0AAV2K861_KNICA
MGISTVGLRDYTIDVSVSSVLSLSSVRELPVQVRELYSEGFVLVAVHPFVHACGPPHARVQRQLHRAVLMRQNHRQTGVAGGGGGGGGPLMPPPPPSLPPVATETAPASSALAGGERWETRELRWCRHRLETDVCVGGNQAADPDSIQSYVKKAGSLWSSHTQRWPVIGHLCSILALPLAFPFSVSSPDLRAQWSSCH